MKCTPHIPDQAISAISTYILAVACKTVGGWKAFIAPVEGRSHEDEWEDVMKFGATMDEDLARFLFPAFSDLPYDR